MPPRTPPKPNPALDRPLRALGREDPEAVLGLLRLARPELLPARARVTPLDVADPHLELGPVAGVADFVVRVGRWLILHVEFQGYRERTFRHRMVFYNAALLRRYPDRRVVSVAIWTRWQGRGAWTEGLRVGRVTLDAPGIVLPELPAELLLRSAKTACFAVGGALGEMNVNTVCQQVVEVMMHQGASEAAWRVARVVAADAGRYDAFVAAMEQVKVKPPLTDDLVRYGMDRGYRRGRQRGLQRGREQGRAEGRAEGLRRALCVTYEARFGALPPGIIAALEATDDTETLAGWQAIFSTRTQRAISAALRRSRRG